ncbi:MAG: 1-acyl-sn-glycerol-3-phosphate acyltransferase, partial [Planctomycetota bacterium]
LFFAFLKPRPIHHAAAATGPDPAGSDPPRASPRSAVGATRFLRDHLGLVFLIGIHAGVWGVAAAVYSGVLAVAKRNYGLADNELFSVFSVIGAGLGFGMLTGAVVVGVVKTMRESTILLSGSLAVAGLCVLLFAWSPNAWVGAAVAFGLGVVGNVVIITSLTMVQALSPSFVRGRVMGVAAVADNLTIIFVHLAVWQMGERSDRLLVIVMQLMGPAMLAFGGVWLLRYMCRGPMPTAGANFFWHLCRLFCLVYHRLEWSGRHHLPQAGPVVVAANHTTALDPFLMQVALPRQVRWLMLTSYRFKSIEFFWRIINPVFIDNDPVTGERKSATTQVRQIVGHLKDGDCLGIFPEGHLQGADRVLKPFEDGVAVTARLSKAQILPCWIEGTAVTGSMLKQFFVPGHRRVVFGEPFTPARGDSPEAITAELRRRMLALASAHAREQALAAPPAEAAST